MAKEKMTEEIVKDTSKKPDKKEIKKAKKLEKEAILTEKKKMEDKIDELQKRKKETKDKQEKKNLNGEIKTVKKQRSKVGKKDTFFGDVMAEMRLVRWPNKKEIFKYSIACLGFVLFFALFFFGIDALFALVKDLIN